MPPQPTADLCDERPDAQVCDPVLSAFGGTAAFSGRIATVTVTEDNALVRAVLERPGEGRVLVVDGGGNERCAFFGGGLAAVAAGSGWAGVVVNGAVRDVAEMADQPVGVRALAVYPRRGAGGDRGREGGTCRFAGVTFREGEWLVADADGVVVLPVSP
ncbi:Regulator of ribonuclease activity A, inhibitor of RNAse E [Modestobacter italicus]|uniref:4-hydroxy-4-methyl-2-oxoglutarate aldolase n=1 Tax=Modestobacter italicus (strain DSM 44449 / CECT 9708 / BC 501) TaxID=2732864 RepID=I4EZ31_MODI5|nr:ribonuclease E activity regulator RraA [Modestobacter marinus]CCH88644.1 Regulator of ribonuclease activity A, inhibitor of RNAse E [Modestobacter marinus]